MDITISKIVTVIVFTVTHFTVDINLNEMLSHCKEVKRGWVVPLCIHDSIDEYT